MTEREREIVSGEADVGDKYRYETISRVRGRIKEIVPKDLEAMEEHGGLAEDLREVVCDEG